MIWQKAPQIRVLAMSVLGASVNQAPTPQLAHHQEFETGDVWELKVMTKYYFNLKVWCCIQTNVEVRSWINLHYRHLETITDYKADYWLLLSKCTWVKVTKFKSSAISRQHKFYFFPPCFFIMTSPFSNRTYPPCPTVLSGSMWAT